jgi:hypothetical protein
MCVKRSDNNRKPLHFQFFGQPLNSIYLPYAVGFGVAELIAKDFPHDITIE